MNMQLNVSLSWGEFGLLFRRVAMTDERQAALMKVWPNAAKAFAAAEALQDVMSLLSDDQKKVVALAMERELRKQGY